MRKYFITTVLLFFITTTLVMARGNHSTRVSFGVGVSEGFEMLAEVEPLGQEMVEVSGGGVVADFAFGKRFGYNWWGHLGFSVNALNLETNTSALGTEANSIALMHLMLGVRNYPLGDASGFRPFLEANIGPVWGVESKTESTILKVGISSKTQTTFGAHVGGGADLQLFSWLAIEAKAGYLFMNEFDEPFRRKDQFDGWDFLLGLNFSWGSY